MTRTETSVGKKLKEKGRGRPPNAPARQLRPRGRQLIRMHAKEAARINSDLAQRIEQLNSFLIAGLPATAEPFYRGLRVFASALLAVNLSFLFTCRTGHSPSS
jgi:hypothetical protein